MINYIEEKIKTSVTDEYDVIVAGGGPAGICAAISAARNSAKTLLIEQSGNIGGLWINGMVNLIFDYKNKSGILREAILKAKSLNQFGGFWNSCFSLEYFRSILENMLIDSGVTIMCSTFASKLIVEDGKATGVITESKDGRTAHMAKTVIDCTGDGDLAVSGGADYDIGNNGDYTECQSMTLMFLIGGNTYIQNGAYALRDKLIEAKEMTNSDYVIPFDRPFILNIPNSDTAVVQLTHMRGYNPLSATDLTTAAIEGRKQAIETVELLKVLPEFQNIELLQTAPLIGVRETRRIECEYEITLTDALNGKQFDDSVCTVTFNIDLHNAKNTLQHCMEIKPYGIPMRSMIPKKIDNLLVAGKCICGDHEVMASYRVTGNCAAMGEAVGTAAAISAKTGINVRNIDFDVIADILYKNGFIVPKLQTQENSL